MMRFFWNKRCSVDTLLLSDQVDLTSDDVFYDALDDLKAPAKAFMPPQPPDTPPRAGTVSASPVSLDGGRAKQGSRDGNGLELERDDTQTTPSHVRLLDESRSSGLCNPVDIAGSSTTVSPGKSGDGPNSVPTGINVTMLTGNAENRDKSISPPNKLNSGTKRKRVDSFGGIAYQNSTTNSLICIGGKQKDDLVDKEKAKSSQTMECGNKSKKVTETATKKKQAAQKAPIKRKRAPKANKIPETGPSKPDDGTDEQSITNTIPQVPFTFEVCSPRSIDQSWKISIMARFDHSSSLSGDLVQNKPQ